MHVHVLAYIVLYVTSAGWPIAIVAERERGTAK